MCSLGDGLVFFLFTVGNLVEDNKLHLSAPTTKNSMPATAEFLLTKQQLEVTYGNSNAGDELVKKLRIIHKLGY